ncbi:MAG: hypothetical protein OEY36_11535 [Gammaproteobacteria bacterium]|nr:hypothetical protein [Gammaproteobacteria bacterium]
MSKRNAFLIHLAISILVFSVLLMLIIYVWYPAPYFDMSYRIGWIKLIAFVDVVIGPGLTLLVYKADKPSLRFDMSVVVILQVTALTWGVWNAWSVHPRLNVYFDSQVYCLDSAELNVSGFEQTLVSSPMPAKLMTILPYPESPEQKLDYLSKASGGRSMVYFLGQKYQLADQEMTSQLDQDQSGFVAVATANEHNKQQWNRFLSESGEINPDWRYYRFNCIEDQRTIVFNRSSNKIEAVLDIALPVSWEFQ